MGTTDFERERHRMVEDLRRRGIDDPAVLAAMARVPRERFVPVAVMDEAHADRPLPIGEGQTISQPYIVAFTAQAMQVQPGDRVLDVGTGSGYAAAVLSCLGCEVWSIERLPGLAARAQRVLDDLGTGVEVVVGDGSLGWSEAAPYDAIGVAAASPHVPSALVEQLADGGRLVLPVGEDHGWQELVRLRRDGDEVVSESLSGVRFVPLIGQDANPPGGGWGLRGGGR